MASPEPHASLSCSVGFRLTVVLGVLSLLVGLLLTIVRPWYKAWGATWDEIDEGLPFEYASASAPHETRAIDINAPAAQVFAWVAQLGQDRAGFYSYELLEDLVGCNMPDLRSLDPALQGWKLGIDCGCTRRRSSTAWVTPPSSITSRVVRWCSPHIRRWTIPRARLQARGHSV